MTTSTLWTAGDGVEVERTQPDNNESAFTRREFLTYAWGASLALLAAEGATAGYYFLLPQFRAGEFGGQFPLGPAGALSGVEGSAPAAISQGKFWLAHTDEGVKALYMVCTHLGCLYKWNSSSTRFECPCHGSKFTLNGDIEIHREPPMAAMTLTLCALRPRSGQLACVTAGESGGMVSSYFC